MNLRSKELKEGGSLVIVVPALGDPLTEDDINVIRICEAWHTLLLETLKSFNLNYDENYNVPGVIRQLKFYKMAFDEKKTDLKFVESFSWGYKELTGCWKRPKSISSKK